jgi:predicted transcriptional regulator
MADLLRFDRFLVHSSFTVLAPRNVLRGEIDMVIKLTPELEAALNELARRRGVAPEVLALDALRDRLIAMTRVVEPRDEWERLVIQAGTNCGISLPHEALSSEGLYE